MDYDSARHHLEAVQNAKKKDEAKTAKVNTSGKLPPSPTPTVVAGSLAKCRNGWVSLAARAQHPVVEENVVWAGGGEAAGVRGSFQPLVLPSRQKKTSARPRVYSKI